MCGKKRCAPCDTKRVIKSRNYLTKPIMPTNDFIGMGSEDFVSLKEPENMSSFIEPCDVLPAWFAIAMYQPVRPQEKWGYSYYPRLSSERVGVWVSCNKVIIAFRGTSIGQSGGKKDVLDDIAIATNETSCDLTITRQGMAVINDMVENGFQSFYLSGHSLGGRAAFCLSTYTNVKRATGLNVAAPIVNPLFLGAPEKSFNYHIVGDIISTHVSPMAARTIRVLKHRNGKEVNWADKWYHSSERFWGFEGFEYFSADQEQANLEHFFLFRAAIPLTFLSAATSAISLNFYNTVKELICTTPIPGAVSQESCRKRGGGSAGAIAEQVAASLVGAVVGFFTGGPVGAVAGFQLGKGLAKGDILDFLNTQVTGYSLASQEIKKAMVNILKDAIESDLDAKKAISEEAHRYFAGR